MSTNGEFKRVFLVTPFIQNGRKNPDFAPIRSQLYKNRNVDVVVAQASIYGSHKERPNRAMQIAIREMMKCKEVITTPDWHEYEECKKMVEVARLCGLEVISAINYIKLPVHD